MANKSSFRSPPDVRTSGYSVFVVGVADVDMTELRIIGSKPSERHVFVVDDYDAFAKIQDNLITFICETATSSKSAARPGVKIRRRRARRQSSAVQTRPLLLLQLVPSSTSTASRHLVSDWQARHH